MQSGSSAAGGLEFIDWLNGLLAPHEESFFGKPDCPTPSLHVVGLPRSGTTLTTQLLARHTNIGYISNLSAVFGSAPGVGMALQKLLEGRASGTELTSSFGKTHGVWEPHEFGYFWRALFDYPATANHDEPDAGHEDRINWGMVRSKLDTISAAWGGPVMFKPVYLCWHAARFAAEVPASCFVVIRRDALQNAISLYETRRKTIGVDKWFSLRPRALHETEGMTPEAQVASQVRQLQHSVAKQFSAIPPERILSIDYEDLCSDPYRFLVDAQALLHSMGGELNLKLMHEMPPLVPRERALDRPSFRRIAQLLDRS